MKNHRFLIGITAAIAIGMTYLHSAQSFEQRMLQWFSRYVPVNTAEPRVGVITIDENSVKANYQTIADLLNKLSGTPVESVGLIMPLAHSENYFRTLKSQLEGKKKTVNSQTEKILKNLDYDSALKQALGKSRAVILPVNYVTAVSGANVEKSEKLVPLTAVTKKESWMNTLPWLFEVPEANVDVLTQPQEGFIHHAKALGMNHHGGSSAVVIRIDGNYYPSLITQMATQLLAEPIEIVPGYGMRIAKNRIAMDPEFRLHPQPLFDGAGLKVPQIPAQEILQSADVNKLMTGLQAVVVGVTGEDGFRVYGNIPTNAILWSAYNLNALLSQQLIEQPYWSVGVQRLIIVISALYLMFLPAKLRGWLGFALSVFASILAVNTSFLMLSVFNTAQPLVIPAGFVLIGHLLLVAHHKVSSLFKSLQLEAANAYRELGATLQAQGRLDEAFNYMRKSSMDKKLIECLYNLGLEFERRRQFNQAVAVYDYIAQKDANYRDIQERRVRHQTQSNRQILNSTMNSHTATLVVDHPNVAQPVLGRYQIERILGQGAMGTVYLGVDPKISRTVAIKTLPISDEFDGKQVDDVRRRFFREAETAGRLNHPNIVTIFDVGEEHDLAYIAMDYISGEGLDCYSHSDSLLSVDEVFYIGVTVAEALEYAHQQNVVHRDIKPSNIMYDIESGNLKITDFGIACLTDNTRTRTGTVLGSPSYMSPEQLSGDGVDGRSDLYSLGITLYQLFTGVLPFMADSMASLAYKIANEKPKGVRKIRPELPACLTRVINKAIEKDPQKRFQCGAALADALRRCSK